VIAAALVILILLIGGVIWYLLPKPLAAGPVLSPAAGSYGNPLPISISDATPHAVIHYTIDGSPATLSSPVYSQPIASLPSGATVRAIATADRHKPSAEIAGVYTWANDPSQANPYTQGEDAYNHKQYGQARTFFQQSCTAGEMRACNYLGYLYAQGLGGGRNVQAAATAYQKACERGVFSSCMSLGTIYQDSQDSENARKYFKRGCDGGLADACELLRNLP